ncbi:MAG: acyltransferase [Marinilabiliaceae bacterium]|nr:acyltransferase [Marinilabiliaceae bacterium]
MRVAYFDFLNVAACIAVLCLHHNGIVHQGPSNPAWASALVAEVLFYWAVPIFYMLTGATLMSYRQRYDTRHFLVARFKRTFIPFLFFSVVWSIKNILMGEHEYLNSINWINGFLNTEFCGVYWFFWTLFAIYAVLPIFSLISDRPRVLRYFVFIAFSYFSVLVPILKFIGVDTIYSGASIAVPISTMLLGYLIATDNTPFLSRHRYWVYTAGIASLVLRYVYTYYYSVTSGEMDRFFFTYNYFTAIIPAIAVFLGAKSMFSRIDLTHSNAVNTLRTLSSLSFGVYLLHPFVLAGYSFLHLDYSSIVVRVLLIPITYALCAFATYIAKKIPYLRILIP